MSQQLEEEEDFNQALSQRFEVEEESYRSFMLHWNKLQSLGSQIRSERQLLEDYAISGRSFMLHWNKLQSLQSQIRSEFLLLEDHAKLGGLVLALLQTFFEGLR